MTARPAIAGIHDRDTPWRVSWEYDRTELRIDWSEPRPPGGGGRYSRTSYFGSPDACTLHGAPATQTRSGNIASGWWFVEFRCAECGPGGWLGRWAPFDPAGDHAARLRADIARLGELADQAGQ